MQLRKKKREEVLAQKRNLGGTHSAPILICIISLQEDLILDQIVSKFKNADDAINVYTSPCGITHIRYFVIHLVYTYTNTHTPIR